MILFEMLWWLGLIGPVGMLCVAILGVVETWNDD